MGSDDLFLRAVEGFNGSIEPLGVVFVCYTFDFIRCFDPGRGRIGEWGCLGWTGGLCGLGVCFVGVCECQKRSHQSGRVGGSLV